MTALGNEYVDSNGRRQSLPISDKRSEKQNNHQERPEDNKSTASQDLLPQSKYPDGAHTHSWWWRGKGEDILKIKSQDNFDVHESNT